MSKRFGSLLICALRSLPWHPRNQDWHHEFWGPKDFANSPPGRSNLQVESFSLSTASQSHASSEVKKLGTSVFGGWTLTREVGVILHWAKNLIMIQYPSNTQVTSKPSWNHQNQAECNTARIWASVFNLENWKQLLIWLKANLSASWDRKDTGTYWDPEREGPSSHWRGTLMSSSVGNPIHWLNSPCGKTFFWVRFSDYTKIWHFPSTSNLLDVFRQLKAVSAKWLKNPMASASTNCSCKAPTSTRWHSSTVDGLRPWNRIHQLGGGRMLKDAKVRDRRCQIHAWGHHLSFTRTGDLLDQHVSKCRCAHVLNVPLCNT